MSSTNGNAGPRWEGPAPPAGNTGSDVLLAVFREDVALVVVGHEEEPDDEAAGRDDDRIPEPEVGIARLCDHGEGGRRHEAAEPAVADVIGQRHAGVADPRGEQLHERRRDRPVDHRYENDEVGQHQHQRERLPPEDVEEVREPHDLRIGLSRHRIAARGERLGHLLGERGGDRLGGVT